MTAILGLQFRCQAAQKGWPKILVVSHERSGTHFVMNSLALNFGYVASPWMNMDWELGVNFHSSFAFETLMSNFSGQWIGNIFKTHHEFGFFSDWIHKFRNEFKIIYMVRDVAPVLRSYQRFLLTTDWFEGPKISSPSEFIRANPVGGLTRFQYRYAETMTHRWCNHVQGWLQGGQSLGTNCFMPVLYSSLNDTFESTMHELAAFIGLPLPQQIVKPDRFANVVYPSDLPQHPLEGFPLNKADHAFLETTAGDTQQLIANCFEKHEGSVLGVRPEGRRTVGIAH